MKKLLMAAAASAACVAMAPAANAATIPCPTLGSCSFTEAAQTGFFGMSFGKNASFDDLFQVTLSSDYNLTVTMTSSTATGGPINFSKLELLDSSMAFLGNFGNDGVMGPLTLPLTAGTYYVHIAGSTGNKAASYSGTIDIAAIPEPATWAMMLVGIAAIGTAMRRRSQNVRVSFS